MELLDFYEALSIPLNRANDLARRAASGSLTEIEQLAMMVVRGEKIAESAAQGLIDKATEEFGSGGYRVPVRVIADMSKAFCVVNLAKRIPKQAKNEIRQEIIAFMESSEGKGVIVCDEGIRLDFYEVEKPTDSPVKIVQPEQFGED